MDGLAFSPIFKLDSVFCFSFQLDNQFANRIASLAGILLDRLQVIFGLHTLHGVGKYVIDNYDYIQISHGSDRVPGPYVKWWNNQPIKGLFQAANPTKASKYVRERIHILAFVCEREYMDTEICSKVFCAPNPIMFPSAEQSKSSFASMPSTSMLPSAADCVLS
jgi:hypothetical protein